MSIEMGRIVQELPNLVSLARGSESTTVDNLRAPENAMRNSLIFVSNAALLRIATECPAPAWVVHTSLADQVPAHVATVLVSPNVQLSMALIAKKLFPVTVAHKIVGDQAIHPRAVVAPSAQLGENCIVGPGAVIGENCVLGANCIIGANAILEPRVRLGARTHIHPLVFIGHNCEIGDDCEIQPNTTIGSEGYGYAQDAQFNHFRITHYGRVIVENNVHIGANVQIDRGTYLDSRIGSGTRIDNHCHFGHNIQIGNNTLITGGMITAGSVTLGSHCVFGGRTTIAGHLTVGDKVHIGGMSGITKSVLTPGQYSGLPLQPLKDELRTRASFKSLPTMVKQVRRILNHLGLEASKD